MNLLVSRLACQWFSCESVPCQSVSCDSVSMAFAADNFTVLSLQSLAWPDC
jgi:hypothetical protein